MGIKTTYAQKAAQSTQNALNSISGAFQNATNIQLLYGKSQAQRLEALVKNKYEAFVQDLSRSNDFDSYNAELEKFWKNADNEVANGNFGEYANNYYNGDFKANLALQAGADISSLKVAGQAKQALLNYENGLELIRAEGGTEEQMLVKARALYDNDGSSMSQIPYSIGHATTPEEFILKNHSNNIVSAFAEDKVKPYLADYQLGKIDVDGVLEAMRSNIGLELRSEDDVTLAKDAIRSSLSTLSEDANKTAGNKQYEILSVVASESIKNKTPINTDDVIARILATSEAFDNNGNLKPEWVSFARNWGYDTTSNAEIEAQAQKAVAQAATDKSKADKAMIESDKWAMKAAFEAWNRTGDTKTFFATLDMVMGNYKGVDFLGRTVDLGVEGVAEMEYLYESYCKEIETSLPAMLTEGGDNSIYKKITSLFDAALNSGQILKTAKANSELKVKNAKQFELQQQGLSELWQARKFVDGAIMDFAQTRPNATYEDWGKFGESLMKTFLATYYTESYNGITEKAQLSVGGVQKTSAESFAKLNGEFETSIPFVDYSELSRGDRIYGITWANDNTKTNYDNIGAYGINQLKSYGFTFNNAKSGYALARCKDDENGMLSCYSTPMIVYTVDDGNQYAFHTFDDGSVQLGKVAYDIYGTPVWQALNQQENTLLSSHKLQWQAQEQGPQNVAEVQAPSDTSGSASNKVQTVVVQQKDNTDNATVETDKVIEPEKEPEQTVVSEVANLKTTVAENTSIAEQTVKEANLTTGDVAKDEKTKNNVDTAVKREEALIDSVVSMRPNITSSEQRAYRAEVLYVGSLVDAGVQKDVAEQKAEEVVAYAENYVNTVRKQLEADGIEVSDAELSSIVSEMRNEQKYGKTAEEAYNSVAFSHAPFYAYLVEYYGLDGEEAKAIYQNHFGYEEDFFSYMSMPDAQYLKSKKFTPEAIDKIINHPKGQEYVKELQLFSLSPLTMTNERAKKLSALRMEILYTPSETHEQTIFPTSEDSSLEAEKEITEYDETVKHYEDLGIAHEQSVAIADHMAKGAPASRAEKIVLGEKITDTTEKQKTVVASDIPEEQPVKDVFKTETTGAFEEKGRDENIAVIQSTGADEETANIIADSDKAEEYVALAKEYADTKDGATMGKMVALKNKVFAEADKQETPVKKYMSFGFTEDEATAVDGRVKKLIAKGSTEQKAVKEEIYGKIYPYILPDASNYRRNSTTNTEVSNVYNGKKTIQDVIEQYSAKQEAKPETPSVESTEQETVVKSESVKPVGANNAPTEEPEASAVESSKQETVVEEKPVVEQKTETTEKRNDSLAKAEIDKALRAEETKQLSERETQIKIYTDSGVEEKKAESIEKLVDNGTSRTDAENIILASFVKEKFKLNDRKAKKVLNKWRELGRKVTLDEAYNQIKESL